MDYRVLLALWAIYDRADAKQQKLLIYTFILLHLLRQNKRIYAHRTCYTKEEVKKLEYELSTRVRDLLIKQYNEIAELIEESLIDSYTQAQRILNEELLLDIDLTEEEIRRLVNETWIGDKNFKQRLVWNLNEILEKYLELLQDDAEEWEYKKLQQNYYYRLRRLLDTETHRDINQACQTAYKAKGIDFVEWIAHMDEKTCPVCASWDRVIFPISSAPFCPDHPFCRCLIIPSTQEDYKRWILNHMVSLKSN